MKWLRYKERGSAKRYVRIVAEQVVAVEDGHSGDCCYVYTTGMKVFEVEEKGDTVQKEIDEAML